MKMPNSLRRKSKAEVAIYLFVSLVFAVIAFSYVYIYVWAIIAGTKTHVEIVNNPFSLPEVWNWKHYIEAFTLFKVNGVGFWEMLFNSIYFSVVCTLVQQFVTIAFAYCCTKYKFPGSELPYLIILIMSTLPIYGTAGATYRLYSNLGILDSYAQIICATAGFSMQFLIYRGFYKNTSWAYAEAAMMDGADEFKIFTKVMFPLAKPIFWSLFLSSWLGTWNSYSSGLIYHPSLPTLPVGIYQFNTEMVYRARLDILFAACIIISIPAVVLFTAFNKMLTTSISVGGIKG